MKRFWMIFVIAALLLTACGAEPEPTMSPADVQSTAMAAAMTMVAETQAAAPTATIPPTQTPTETPLPTNTVPPLILETATQGLATQPVGALPTNTSTSSSGSSGDPCNKPLTSWGGESAQLTLRNNTKPKGTVTASLYFTTSFGDCGYISARFDNSTTLTVPVGTFSAGAFVDGPKDFKIFGGGTITRSANYSLWFENETISLKAGCAPNC